MSEEKGFSFSGLIKGVAGVITGGVSDKVIDIVKDVLPDHVLSNMSDADKLRIQQQIKAIEHKQVVEIQQMTFKETQQFYDHLNKHEGTAADLQQFGNLGKIIVFARGMFRPVFSYCVVIYAALVFLNIKTIPQGYNDLFQGVMYIVIGFYYGERALKNVIPVFKGPRP